MLTGLIDHYLKMAMLNQEYQSCMTFDLMQDYAIKLNQYLHYSDNYKEKEFFYLTNQLGETAVFRAYLRRYIKGFEPEVISKEKGIWLVLDKSGKFKAKHFDGKAYEDTNLCKGDDLIFKYLCYSKLNEFWKGAEELRGPSN